MYESFFDLKMLPFKITPDPQFIYWNKEHRRAASIIAFGIEQLVPITVVTGDVGTGKTTLLQQFLEDTPADTTVGLISNYWSGMGGLYQWILNAFDLPADGTEVQQFRAFQDFVVAEYAAGRRVVLIVDEAQNMSDADLEQLRMLTNINSGKDSLMMLFLVGQHQLRDRLREPGNQQIAQRVGAAFHLGPMSRADTSRYVRHRIKVAGGETEIFDDAALDRIHEASGGVPRMINVLCELALVTAYGDGVREIDAAFVDELLREARENGMIAHLPVLSEPEPDSPVTDPSTSASLAPSPPVAREARARSAGAAIRLVAQDPEAEEMPGDAMAPVAPAARAPEPEGTDPRDAADAPEPAEIMEAVMAERMAQRRDAVADPVPEPERAPPPETDATPAPEPETEPSASEPRTPAAPGRRRLSGLADHALSGLLVVLAAAAVFALILRAPAPIDSATESEPPAPAALVAAPPALDPLDNPEGGILLERALSLGGTDPAGAAIAYARAALRGEAQAAYYLGQMFETGAGIPRDLALARAWYDSAQEDVRSARRRLGDLPAPDTEGSLAPPLPVLGGPLTGGGSEFAWLPSDGVDAAFYVLETAAAPDGSVARAAPVSLSAAQVDIPPDARVWRVIAAAPDAGRYAASDWQKMGAASAAAGASPVRANVVLHGPAAVRDAVTARLSAELPDAAVTSSDEVLAPATTPEIGHVYHEDAELARQIADLIAPDATVLRIDRAEGAQPLPGFIRIALPTP